MYIREKRTQNKRTGEVYTKHVLVESVATEKGPRQKTVMYLENLTVPRIDWKRLAHAIECELTGQLCLLEEGDAPIVAIAKSYASNTLLKHHTRKARVPTVNSGVDLCNIHLDTLATSQCRSLGGEIVAEHAWNLIGMGRILKSLELSTREIKLAKAVIFGRLISPGSEVHTYQWVQSRSALVELPGCQLDDVGLNAYYSIGDTLYDNKDSLESLLYRNESTLFPENGTSLLLFDLTNTYLEGAANKNKSAKRGHCKKKRSDCKLISLAMIVRKDGMPVLSRVYPGNQSEPETMENMLTDLEKKINHNQVSFDKPTIVMDRGIATKENIDYLVEKKYDYTVIRREDQSVRFRDEFINNRTSFRQIQIHTSSYGESNAVFVKKMPNNGESTCEVLCISEGRARKEEAMDLQRSTRFLEKVAAFNQTIVKNTIKKEEKIEEKKRKLEEKNPAMMKKFALVLLRDAKSTIIGIEAQPIPQNEIPLFGCYVIESTHTEMTDEEIWHLYMQQTHVEAAFEAMKGELGMRPVYHQTESRTSAHLFITVLAYHLLATIEHLLQLQGDHRKWSTIRTELSTHTRSTVSFIDSKNISHQIRLSGKPEAAHQDIYKKLEVKDPTKRREFTLNSAQIEK